MGLPHRGEEWESEGTTFVRTVELRVSYLFLSFLRAVLISVSADISWASLNRGVLICEECCSVHRVLGRHISLVKPLRRTSAGWPPSLLTVCILLGADVASWDEWKACLV